MASQEKISLLLKISLLEQNKKVPEKPVWRNDLSQQLCTETVWKICESG